MRFADRQGTDLSLPSSADIRRIFTQQQHHLLCSEHQVAIKGMGARTNKIWAFVSSLAKHYHIICSGFLWQFCAFGEASIIIF